MKKIKNIEQLSAYVDRYNLQDYMDSDILAMASLHYFDKEDHLIQSETTSDYLYFLVKGTVMVYSYSSDTQNICIDYVEPASLIGEASSLWGLVPKSNVKAVSHCICISISLKKYRAKLQADVRFLQNICQLLSYRLNSNVNLANSLTEPVETRLAKFILSHYEGDQFSVRLTTCAAILNVSYRHLIRMMTNFREANIIEKKKNYYLILDFDKLIELSKKLSG
ncbi:cyclic nucleotide-binding domain-containing protein [Vagococcus xieshaowenii]|uniref:Cyclic nucleotide-binding domain-containing protein n=1 Tax=Vagococcus xieshaowenii TaxID=2562451 RepID=A0A4Z0D266_9ENTE|nr:cyclic nucleotide-binding domain-containing protein [Vagococcus xieshaowenii]QCA27914.1 cyclic nucleotide-binding domain-containing protein [Vagococcus xieshaowenii]TFZ39408.1 cyclic nucleotide-binding domain-containing protein [Vagococcus xieshaowenii]